MAMTPTNDPAQLTPDLAVLIGKVRLKNPFMTASGTCGYGEEYAPYMDQSRLGAFTTKSVTLRPRKGNAPPRVVEMPAGLLNSIGLANVGLERFMVEKLPMIAALGTEVFVNVAGHSVEEYVEVCRRIDTAECIAGVELNVSCPNVSDGMTFGTDPGLLKELVAAARTVVRRGVLIVKLTPNVTDITATARAAIDGGADALSMVNTFLGMSIDIDRRRPRLSRGSGGYSGPAIKPMAVHLIHKVYHAIARDAGIPIIGMGGVRNWRDAVEFMLAGATGIAVGTELFAQPDAPLKMIDGLSQYLRDNGIARATDLVGALL